ncbi:MAG: hypothetical protein GX877_06675 [Bacteroidales bacterium]|nr:hypothetical protein [Bacteroidales bacterium]
MRKIVAIVGFALLPLFMPSCWLVKEKPEQVTSYLYKEVIYEFNDGVDYFTADLLSCYGVKDIDDPTTGTIYASISIKVNTASRLLFESSADFADKCFITKHMEYPQVNYPATPFSYQYDAEKGETIRLDLNFPNVPTSILKIGSLRVSVRIRGEKRYAFTVHQIPFRPISDMLTWR